LALGKFTLTCIYPIPVSEEFCSIPSMKITSVGYGAGTKSFKNHPNVPRVIIGE
jgi:uncharacterized protein (DUF111 family)